MTIQARYLLLISLCVMVSCHVPQNQKYEVLRPPIVAPVIGEINPSKTIKQQKFLSLKPKRISKPKPSLAQNFIEAYKGLVMPPLDNLNRGFVAGDQVRITVFREDNLSNIFVVNETGGIEYPLLGDVNVLGDTPSSLALKLKQKLKGDYLVNPNVAVDRVLYCVVPPPALRLKAG
jgi:Polysaccharide biosynthesis/export protein